MPESSENKIYFKDFIGALSQLTRGSTEERIKWVFNLYDLDKDGQINKNVIKIFFNKIYYLIILLKKGLLNIGILMYESPFNNNSSE